MQKGLIRIAIMTDTMDRSARGTALYTRKLVKNLLPLAKEFGFEFTLVHSNKNNDALYREAKELILPKISIPKIGKILSESWFLIRSRGQFDIIHYPQEANYPLFWLSDARIVLSVLSHIEGWKEFGLPIRYRMVKATLGYFGWRISAIICGSASSVKKSLMRNFSIPESKIFHTSLGVDDVFFKAPVHMSAKEHMARTYSFKTPYILAPARQDIQKNVPRIVEAFARAKKEMNLPHALYFGSTHRSDEDGRVQDVIRKYRLESVAQRFPFIENVDMPALYAGADVTVFPSLHEGFGLPILESMAVGTPVITSNVYSMPEVAGGAALLVNPKSVDEIKDALVKLLTNQELATELREKGKKNAQLFSWEKMGRETAEVYRHVAKTR